jgi:hypothetical protein
MRSGAGADMVKKDRFCPNLATYEWYLGIARKLEGSIDGFFCEIMYWDLNGIHSVFLCESCARKLGLIW